MSLELPQVTYQLELVHILLRQILPSAVAIRRRLVTYL